MIAETVRVLSASALLSSAAILTVLALRKPIRVRFGAHVAYALWLLVPLAAATALLPAPVRVVHVAPAPIAALPLTLPAAQASKSVQIDPMPLGTRDMALRSGSLPGSAVLATTPVRAHARAPRRAARARCDACRSHLRLPGFDRRLAAVSSCRRISSSATAASNAS